MFAPFNTNIPFTVESPETSNSSPLRILDSPLKGSNFSVSMKENIKPHVSGSATPTPETTPRSHRTGEPFGDIINDISILRTTPLAQKYHTFADSDPVLTPFTDDENEGLFEVFNKLRLDSSVSVECYETEHSLEWVVLSLEEILIDDVPEEEGEDEKKEEQTTCRSSMDRCVKTMDTLNRLEDVLGKIEEYDDVDTEILEETRAWIGMFAGLRDALLSREMLLEGLGGVEEI
ncbi:hypothetical protein BDQ12DRAFT_739683 [Crucibulum laeve]|uniref:Uncharacterized protein n=1 Tax=Crucibulum laeve TaxID=68775 RepID=A0A5C3LFQ6_9AGAR|nr:hypothetical protein BDQ12DRAFT_739683 [Crucibulum laeve]